jgi:hypothetical protein
MPRHPRVPAEGLLYLVLARGNDGQKIFLRKATIRPSSKRFGPCVSVPVLSLRLCLDVELLPPVVGSRSVFHGANPAIAAHRLRAAL